MSSVCARMCRQLTIVVESLPANTHQKALKTTKSMNITETQRERHGDLTKQRDPVSNQSGQLTEQTRAEQQEVKETARGRRNGSLNR